MSTAVRQRYTTRGDVLSQVRELKGVMLQNLGTLVDRLWGSTCTARSPEVLANAMVELCARFKNHVACVALVVTYLFSSNA